jgi:hypothetical protein
VSPGARKNPRPPSKEKTKARPDGYLKNPPVPLFSLDKLKGPEDALQTVVVSHIEITYHTNGSGSYP